MRQPGLLRGVAWLQVLLAPAVMFPSGKGCGEEMQSVIRPAALQVGGVVAIVAPSYPIQEDQLALASERLGRLGFHVRVFGDPNARRGYLAGADEERAEALRAAFADPQVSAVFCGAGGFGATRILPLLDFETIRRNPKILIGFSDITALHLAIGRECSLVTFHGPVLGSVLGSEKTMSRFTSFHLWRAILSPTTLGLLAERAHDENDFPVPVPLTEPAAVGEVTGYPYDLSLMPGDGHGVKTLRPGVARGTLTGGNLSIVAALMGTPWEIETEGRILFLEDIGEEPYRIDRMLSQLRNGGKLDSVAGVVLGKWTSCAPRDESRSLTLDEIFDDYFGHAPCPVVAYFPVGHVRDNATIPMQVLAELDADRKTLRLLEEPTVH